MSDSETEAVPEDALESSAFTRRRFSPSIRSPSLIRDALRPKPIKMTGDGSSQELKGSSDDEPQFSKLVNFKPTGGVFRVHNPRTRIGSCGDLLEGASKAKSEGIEGIIKSKDIIDGAGCKLSHSYVEKDDQNFKICRTESLLMQKQQPIKSIKNIVMIPSTAEDGSIAVTTIQTAVFSKLSQSQAAMKTSQKITKLDPHASGGQENSSSVNDAPSKPQSLLISKTAVTLPPTPTTPGAKTVRSVAPITSSNSHMVVLKPQTLQGAMVVPSSPAQPSPNIIKVQPVAAISGIVPSCAVNVVGVSNSSTLLGLSQTGSVLAAVSSGQITSFYPNIVLKPNVGMSTMASSGALQQQSMPTISLTAITSNPPPQTPPLTPTQLQYIVPVLQTSGDGRSGILQMIIPGQQVLQIYFLYYLKLI